MSGITYFCIANGTVILTHASQDPTMKEKIVGGITNLLSKIDTSRNYDGADATNTDEVLVRVNNRITYLLLAVKGTRKTTMFNAMDSIFREFTQRYSPDALFSLPSFALDSAFSSIILNYISNVAPSKVDMIKDDAIKIRDKTFDNIEKMYQRADYLNSIADKSDTLKSSALDFSSAANKLKNDMRKKKIAIITGCSIGAVVLALIIILPIVL